MKIFVDLNELIRFATYDGLFDNVSLINYPELEHSIQEAMTGTLTDKHPCYIDCDHSLWPMHEWIKECKRRASLNELGQAAIQLHRERPRDLKAELIKAAMAGDTERVKQIQQEIANRK